MSTPAPAPSPAPTPATPSRYARLLARYARLRVWLAGSYRDLLGMVARSTLAGVAFVALLGLLLAALALLVVNAVLVRYLPDTRPPALKAAEMPLPGKSVQLVAESHFEAGVWRRFTIVPKRPDGDTTSQYPTLLVVEIVEKRAKGVFAIELKLHHLKSVDKLEEVEWWMRRSVARSNAVLHVAPHPRFGLFMYALDFPTSEQALTSYIRTHWPKDVVEFNEAYKSDPGLKATMADMDRQVAARLEQAFGQDLENARTHWAVVTLRIINGPIQWLTIAAFVALLLTIWARWCVFVRAEHHPELRSRRPTAGQRQGRNFARWLRRELTWVDEQDTAHLTRWGSRSIALTIWGQSLRAAERATLGTASNAADEAVGAARESGDVEQADLDSRGFNLRYLIGALPALGFIGTVWGIADALMNVGGVLSAELAKQQSGIGAVALALSVAFDTTLVALLLALAGGFLAAALTAAEENVVLATRRACQENICPVASSPMPTPTPAPPPRPVNPPSPNVAPAPPPRPAPPPVPLKPIVEPLADHPDDYRDATDRPRRMLWTVLMATALAVGLYLLVVGFLR